MSVLVFQCCGGAGVVGDAGTLCHPPPISVKDASRKCGQFVCRLAA